MKITAIKQQERLKDRYSVFVDGAYAFSLSERALLDSKLASGLEIDVHRLQSFKQLSADDKIYNQVLRWVAARLRSEWEIRQYMLRKQAAPALADDIIGSLRRIGFVDDAAFARAWVENRRLLRPTSIRKLQQELRAKHIADATIQAAIKGDTDHDSNSYGGIPRKAAGADDRQALREVITRKRRQLKYRDDTKLMQYLARQGFGYDDIKNAIVEHNANDPDDIA